jgi:hypothetical protein
MKHLILRIFATLAFVLCVSEHLSAQTHARRYDFHINPASFHVNDYVPNPIMYVYADNDGILYHATAKEKVSRQASSIPLGEVTSYSFVNAARGYATGDHGILTTRDSGKHWDNVSVAMQARWEQICPSMYTDQLFVVSQLAGLWVSSDGGGKWKKALDGSFAGVGFHGLKGVLLAVDEGPSYFTTDGGRNWQPSTNRMAGRMPCYSVNHDAFFVANPRDRGLYKSTDGNSWEWVMTFNDAIEGDIFYDCKDFYVPTIKLTTPGFLRGTPEGGFVPVIAAPGSQHLVYSFSRNEFSYFRGTTKLYLTPVYGVKPVILQGMSNYDVTIPRCSTTTKTITVSIAPLRAGDAEVTLTPITTAPGITLISPASGTTDSVLTFQIELTAYNKAERAVYLLEAKRCAISSQWIYINVSPSNGAADLKVDNVSFGKVGSCSEPKRWVMLRNPDCREVVLQSAELRLPNVRFALVSGQFPRTIPPLGKDSVLVTFDPSTVGSYSGVIDIKYRSDEKLKSGISIVSGTVAAGATASVIDDTVNFGAISSCTPALGQTAIKNSGCGKIQIESATLPLNNKFTLKNTLVGEWLGPEEELPIELEAITSTPGAYRQDLEIIAVAENGGKVPVRIALISEVGLATKDYLLSSPGDVQGLTDCSTVDTSITIQNLSTCDPLQVSSISLASPAVSLLDAFTPSTLQPGQSKTYRLRLSGQLEANISDNIAITTDLFGVLSSPISASVVRARLHQIEATEQPTTFATTRCKPQTLRYLFTTHGCGYLPIKEVRLGSLTGNTTRFSLKLLSIAPPFDLLGEEKLEFEITYDPNLIGDDQALILIEDEDGIELYRQTLTGIVEQVKTSVGLVMTTDHTAPLTMCERLIVKIQASDAVASTAGLTKIQTELHFDQDLFSIESIEPSPGISVQNVATAIGEALTLTAPAFSFEKDELLATITLKPFVTDRTSSDISLSGLVLNDNDEDFARCIMSPSTTLTTSTASVILDCVERTLQQTMAGTVPIIIRGIYPQPAENGDDITIDLSSETCGEYEVVVTNLMGREEYRHVVHIANGNSLLNLPGMNSGYYRVTLRSPISLTSRSLIVN